MSIDPRILKAFAAGSKSHGTYMPPDEPDGIDDVDLMGFVVPPLECHLGLARWHHWVWKHEELDVVLYSLDKAFRLLLKGNPNIVGVLWLRDEDYVHRSPALAAARSREGTLMHLRGSAPGATLRRWTDDLRAGWPRRNVTWRTVLEWGTARREGDPVAAVAERDGIDLL